MATIYRQRVIANTVAFNDALPAGATNFAVDICDGWKDTGDPDESSVELGSYQDGVSAASYFPIRSKFVTIGGYAVGLGEAEAEGLSDLIVRDGFPRNQVFQLTRYEAVPKFMLVRRSGPVEFDWSAVQNGFRWSTVVMAEDPFRYSLTSQTATTGVVGTSTSGHTFPVTFPMTFGSGASTTGGAGIYNAGTAYSRNFTATITGTLNKGAWRLTNDTTGQGIGFNTAVSVGDQLVIDFLNQVATLNGFPLSSDYVGNFWQLAPGSNTIRLYAEFDPTASVTISAYSAWE